MTVNTQICNIPVFNEIEKSSCCGCSACSNACPVDIIKMVNDSEGFLYPKAELENCIVCNKCMYVCPEVQRLKEKKEPRKPLQCLAGSSKQTDIVLRGSSGGIFEILATYFLSVNEDAYIVGAQWNRDFTGVEHVIINSIDELEKLKTSKYVQSDKRKVYKEVKSILDNNKQLMFVGTPCEVSGLRKYLGKGYNNLLLVDFLCKGPTSPFYMKDYIALLNKKYNSNVSYVNMRYKWETLDVWIPQFMYMRFLNGKSKLVEFYNTLIGHAFRIVQRPSCYNCKYIGFQKESDITLADYHGAQKKDSFYNNLGTSLILIHTELGNKYVNNIKDMLKVENVTLEKIIRDNPRITNKNIQNVCRDKFVKIYGKKGLKQAVLKSVSIKEKIKIVIPWKIQRKLIKTNRKSR